MSVNDHKAQYLSLESFFQAHAERLVPLIGERAAQSAWGIKDFAAKSADADQACRRVQAAVEASLGGREADWVLLVSESHEILSLEEWIEDVLKSSKAAAAKCETGYGDLDLNIETQLDCGMQLEAFHAGTWAKQKLTGLFELDSFEELEPLTCKLGVPLPQVINKLDRDLEFATTAGMRHPYKCSVAVGAICLRLAATEEHPETLIPVIRRTRSSEVAPIISRMHDELKERFKGLISTIQEQQANLKLLPEGWPNAEVWSVMQEWARRRFVGDNGLVGSDLFDGEWVATELPHDIHRRMEEPSATPPALNSLDMGARMARRRLPAETFPGVKPPSSRI